MKEIYSEEQWIEWIDTLAEQDYVCIDNFLPEETYSLIEAFFNEQDENERFKKAAIGALADKKIVSEIRGDYTYWIDRKRDESLSPYFDLVDETIAKLNRFCYLSLAGYEFHLTYYPPGSFYKKHVDQFKGRRNRMISMIIYFNEDWKPGDGGELKMYKPEGEELVNPIRNRCVLFRSETVEHEVLETLTGRKSVTGWLLYQPSGVGYILATS